MCGINCIIDHRGIAGESNIIRMNEAIAHRGPDNTAFSSFSFEETKFLVGSNRLRITGPDPKADQPLNSPCGRYLVAFNGEIYNSEYLKTRLPNDLVLTGRSDTEILLHLLILFGPSCLKHLNGMFAFIFLDKSNGKTLIARDRFGIKPLYFYSDSRLSVFSSEIRGIFSSGLVKKELNEESIPSYLQFRYPSPGTFYKNILAVPPGHYFEIDGNKFKQTAFIDPFSIISKPENQPEFEDLIRTAISLQFPTSETALFLSGGTDSTLLLALAAEQNKSNLKAFTVSYPQDHVSVTGMDPVFAEKAAIEYKTDLVKIPLTSASLAEFEAFASGSDQPIADPAAFLTAIISRNIIAKGIKTALSGAGADELFAGYNRHTAYSAYLKYRPFLLLIKPWLKSMPLKDRLFKKAILGIEKDPYRTWLNFISLTTRKDLLKHVKENQYPGHHSRTPFSLEDALKNDRDFYLIKDVLAISDEMTMKYGLELRVPFLDNELVSAAMNLPASFLLKNGKKWILKELLKKKGGRSYAYRKKQGFGMPLDNWLRKKDGKEILCWLQDEKAMVFNFLDFKTTKGLVNSHLSGKASEGHLIWGLSLLSCWMEKEFA